MSYVFHRNLATPLPVIVRGEGNELIAEDGRRYLDACGGAAVSCLGHDHPAVRAAIKDQVDRLAFVHTARFTNQPAEDLAEFLVTRAPPGTGRGRMMYLGSGSEAMEAALKLARQYYLERGEPERQHIIARTPSYHGNTLGALATGGHESRRSPYAPMLMDVHHVRAPYPYRLQEPGESPEAFAQRLAQELEDIIQSLGPERVMAFVVEPVVGASLGSQPPPPGYFARVREICDAHGVLLIADEVMCGMGRTGSLYALEQEASAQGAVCADITTLAKGLAAGYQPLAAVLARESVVQAVAEGSGILLNGHTYMAHAITTAAALVVHRVIEADDLLMNVRARGAQLEAGLRDRFMAHPHVGDIRGRGLFFSVELVADLRSKTPFPSRAGVAMAVREAALALGVLTYPAQGCVDGINGDHVLLAPSYTSSTAQIDRIVDVLKAALDQVLASKRHAS
ncbi:MAG: aspartate aminotransferase family protein [Pseudomonadota bacterium]